MDCFSWTRRGRNKIVAYDAAIKRLFLVDAATATVDILDVRNPTTPTLISTINTSALGAPNSALIKAVKVSALPDMITFTPDTISS